MQNTVTTTEALIKVSDTLFNFLVNKLEIHDVIPQLK